MLNEPRGGVFRHVNLLVPPKDPRADAAFIIMEPEDTPPMSGSNSICVATVLLDGGILPMQEPVTELILEAPGGLVRVRAECRDGKAERIFVQNLPSFAARLGVPLEVEGLGTLTVDTAYGGDSFVIVDPAALGLSLAAGRGARHRPPRRAHHRGRQRGARLPPPREPGLAAHLLLPLRRRRSSAAPTGLRAKAAVAIRPGKVDRSPDRHRALGAHGGAARPRPDGRGRPADGGLADRLDLHRPHPRAGPRSASTPAILPEISGRGWITGIHQHMLDPSDPWPEGYRVSDTWGAR